MWFSPDLCTYTATPYSAVFLLHTLAPAPAPIKIDFGAVRCGAVLVVVSVVSVKLTPLFVSVNT